MIQFNLYFICSFNFKQNYRIFLIKSRTSNVENLIIHPNLDLNLNSSSGMKSQRLLYFWPISNEVPSTGQTAWFGPDTSFIKKHF